MDAANGVGGSVTKRKMFTRWLKLTRLLHITDGNILLNYKDNMQLYIERRNNSA